MIERSENMSGAGEAGANLNDLLCVWGQTMPMPYAVALYPRVNRLLLSELPRSIKRQLLAVKGAIEDKTITECVGLDRLHYCLDEWERRYT